MTTLELLDDPAAQDAVALIEDQRLAGTQGLLRFLEFYKGLLPPRWAPIVSLLTECVTTHSDL